jgi:hypothetical protein
MTITATLVRGGLLAARLPLTVAEVTLRRDDTETWPPSLAFDAFGATVQQVVGSLAHDATLVEQGQLTRAKVSELRRSVELETRAEVLEERANATLTERLEVDEQRRKTATDRAEARQRSAVRAKAEQKRRADEKLAREEQQAAKADRATKAATQRRTRAARSKRAEAERAALAHERHALDAQDVVDDLGDELARSKAQRRATRA